MIIRDASTEELARGTGPAKQNLLKPPKNTKVGFLTDCQDRPYVFGLAMALVSSGICLEVIGGGNEDCPEFHTTCNLRFLNLGGARPEKANLRRKLLRLSRYFARLIRYATFSTSQPDSSGDAESKP